MQSLEDAEKTTTKDSRDKPESQVDKKPNHRLLIYNRLRSISFTEADNLTDLILGMFKSNQMYDIVVEIQEIDA